MTNILVHANTHDEASVVSVLFEVGGIDTGERLAEFIEILKSEVLNVERWAESTGAMVGHIKGYVQPCHGAYTLSATGTGIVSAGGSITAEVGVTAIIMTASLDAVQTQVVNAAMRALKQFGISDVEVEICEHKHSHSHGHGNGHNHGHSHSG